MKDLISEEPLIASMIERLMPSRPTQIAVGVSGGADSLCLLYLLQRWARPLHIRLFPFIVNHGLKPQDFNEARQVQKWIASWGLSAEILTWEHPPLEKGIMEKARYGRYQTLALACHRLGIPYLFIAHHQDEVLETVAMRCQKQESWRGLAGISAVTYWYGVTLVRPLLALTKTVLKNTLIRLGQPWLEDPMNRDLQFSRSHARLLIQNLAPPERFSLVRKVNLYARQRQEEAYKLMQLYRPWGQGFLALHWDEVAACSREEGAVLLRVWIHTFVTEPLRLKGLQQLWLRLQASFKEPAPRGPKTLATFGGCLFIRDQDHLYLFREPGRVRPAPSLLKEQFVWDHRFFCYNLPPLDKRCRVQGGWKERLIFSAFPSLWPHPRILYRPCGLAYPHFTPAA